MIYKPKLNCQRKRPNAFIYTVVFGSRFSVLLILFLFISFAIQPIHQAYASETTIDDVDPTEDAAPAVADDVTPESVSESVEADEETATLDEESGKAVESDSSASAEAVVVDNSATSGDSIDNEQDNIVETSRVESSGSDTDSEQEQETSTSTIDEEEDSFSTTTATNTNSTTDNAAASTSTTTNETEEDEITSTTTAATSTTELATTTSTGSSSSNDSADSVQGDADTNNPAANQSSDESAENDASDDSLSGSGAGTDSLETTEDETVSSSTTSDRSGQDNSPTVTQAQTLITEDNYYQFNRQSCVAIGDGTFHCSVNTGSKIDINAVVYAEMGDNLNMEIFLRSSEGDVEQITSNEYDDTAPHYDAESRQIVWQRLIDDRYQIILYDLEEGEERQLTFSRSNNMEPKVSIEGIVWQAWDGNDWEIMYFDGTFTDQLTSNNSQDVAPAIDDGYILWSVLGADEQEAKVYSIASGETLNISGYEGGIIANPRFVLVYDTKFENGDIITQGFDPTTGLSKPISAKAADDPIDIPDTDSTGETRALIQNKSSQKDEFENELSNNKDPIKSGDNVSSASSTSSTTSAQDQNTLDLNKISSSSIDSVDEQASTTEPTSDDVLELTDYDLILLEPATSTVSTEVGTSSNDTASST